MNSFISESDFLSEFKTVSELKNERGQALAKQRYKRKKKTADNNSNTLRRKIKTATRKRRTFPELPNGGFYKCDHSKIHYRSESMFSDESILTAFFDFCSSIPFDSFTVNYFRIKWLILENYWSYVSISFQGLTDIFPIFCHDYNYIGFLIKIAQIVSSNDRNVPEIITLIKEHAYKSKECPADVRGFLTLLEKSFRFYYLFKSESESDELDDFISDVRPRFRYYMTRFVEYLRMTSEFRILDLFSTFLLCMVDYKSSKQGKIDSLSALICGLLDANSAQEVVIYFLCSFLVPALHSPSKPRPESFYSEGMPVSDMVSNFELFGSTDFFSDVSQVLKFCCFIADEKSFFYRIMNQTTSMKGFLTSSIGISTALYDVWNGRVYLDELFFGPSDIQGLIVESNELLNENTYDGSEIDGRRPLLPYTTELGDLLKRIKTKLSLLPRKHEMRIRLSDLKLRVHERWELCHLKVLKNRRSPPAVILLTGPPGQGKSVVRNHIFNVWSQYDGHSVFKEQYVYPRTQGEKFWDGLDCLTNPYCYFAEVADATSNILQNKGDERLDEILSCADSAPKSLAMAFDKGSQYCLFKGIIMDSNNPTMGVEKYKNCPGAYFRRLTRVHVTLKREYCIPGTTTLDKSKLPKGPISMDIYKYKVEKYFCDEKSSYDYDPTSWKFILPEFSDGAFKRGVHWNDNGEIIDPSAFEALILSMYASHHKHEDILKDQVEEFNNSMPQRYGNISKYADMDNLSGFKVNKPAAHITNKPLSLSKKFSFKSESYFVYYHVAVYLIPLCLLNNYFYSSIPSIEYWWALLFATYCILLITGRKFLSKVIVWFITLSLADYITPFYIKISFLIYICCRFYNGMDSDFIIGCLSFVSKNLYRFDDTISSRMDALTKNYLWLYEHIKFLFPLIFKFITLFQDDKNTLVVGSLFLICQYAWFKKSFSSESSFETLKDVELHYNCGQSFTRISPKAPSLWNVIDNKFSPVHKNDPDQLAQLCSRNVRYIGIRWPDGRLVRQHCLGVKSSYVLANAHSFPENFDDVQILLYGSDDRIKHTITVERCSFARVTHDMVMFPLIGTLFRDLTKHFPTQDFSASNTSGLISNSDVRIFVQNDSVVQPPTGKQLQIPYTFIYEWSEHGVGKCGLPLLARVGNGCSIVGIHSFGASSSVLCGAIPLLRHQLETAINTLNFDSPLFVPHSVGEFPDDVIVSPVVGPKSAFRFEGYNHIECFGKLAGPVLAKSKSKMVRLFPTSFLDDIFNRHFSFVPTVRFSKPMMSSQVRDGTYYNPYNVALRKMDAPPVFMPPRMLTLAADKFVDHLLQVARTIPSGCKLKPLTVRQAINGVENDYAINRINRSTSAGFGFLGSKESNLLREDDGINSYPTSDLEKKMLRIINNYSEGLTCNPVYRAALKDEPRSIEKCLNGKTRLFYVGPLDHLLVQKMFLSPFYALMRVAGDVFGTAVGINAHVEFDALYRKLRDFSPHIMEGDYQSFDITACYMVRASAADVACKLLSKLGYTDEQLTIVKGIFTDNLHICISVLKDLLCRPGLQASGKDATAEDNSFFHVLMYYIFYYNTVDYKKYGDFDKNVLVVTYGDDCLLSVKECIKNDFNNVTYQTFCKRYFGMVFTSASKDSDMLPFIKLEDSRFLKRQFVYNPNYDHYFALLDLNSLYKSLEWRIPSSFVTEEHQCESTLNSFLTESFFHIPHYKEYNLLRSDLIQAFESKFGYKPKLRTFEDVEEGFVKNSS